MRLKSLLPIVLAAVLFGCARYPTIPAVPEPAETAADAAQDVPAEFSGGLPELKGVALSRADSDYVVGPGDSLKITVWGHDDLTRTVQVSEEGNFSYPLIGKVHADELSVSQIEQEITRRLDGKYLINPQVTIVVEEFRSKRVFVLGEVGGPQGHGKGPGAYPLTGQTSLIEILSAAGGLTSEAGGEVVVVRPISDKKSDQPLPPQESETAKVIRLNVKHLLGGDATQNILLEDGDTIYVPSAQYFFVFGQVKNPGRYVLESETTVLKAITMAGGLTEIAAVKKTRILREESGARIERRVEMTSRVMPQDIIMVPESFF